MSQFDWTIRRRREGVKVVYLSQRKSKKFFFFRLFDNIINKWFWNALEWLCNIIQVLEKFNQLGG